MFYARQNPDTSATEVRDFTEVPPAGKRWLPLLIDTQPVPSAAQVLVNAGILFTQTTATQTWSLRAKTAAELDADAATVERAAIKAPALIAALQSGTGTAGERLARCERVLVYLLRNV